MTVREQVVLLLHRLVTSCNQVKGSKWIKHLSVSQINVSNTITYVYQLDTWCIFYNRLINVSCKCNVTFLHDDYQLCNCIGIFLETLRPSYLSVSLNFKTNQRLCWTFIDIVLHLVAPWMSPYWSVK